MAEMTKIKVPVPPTSGKRDFRKQRGIPAETE
jgi:hypothetical protein